MISGREKFKGSVERASLNHWLNSAVFLIFTENGLLNLKISSAGFFLLKCQLKRRKSEPKSAIQIPWHPRALNCVQMAINRTTFYAFQRCRKLAVLAVTSRVLGILWQVEAFNDQQCQSLGRNESLSNENN